MDADGTQVDEMLIEEPGWLLLDDFFRAEARGRSPATVRRHARVRQRLMDFLDLADLAPCLGTEPATLVELERQLCPQGAFWSGLGADELVCCLVGFVQAPWLPRSVAEARTQISLTGRLLTHLEGRGVLDLRLVGCVLRDTEVALQRAREDLAAGGTGSTDP